MIIVIISRKNDSMCQTAAVRSRRVWIQIHINNALHAHRVYILKTLKLHEPYVDRFFYGIVYVI